MLPRGVAQGVPGEPTLLTMLARGGADGRHRCAAESPKGTPRGAGRQHRARATGRWATLAATECRTRKRAAFSRGDVTTAPPTPIFPAAILGSVEMSPLRKMAALENGYGRGPERS